jgi:hypothetical protein
MTKTISSLLPQSLGVWNLGIGIYLEFGAWSLVLAFRLGFGAWNLVLIGESG